MRHGNPLRTMRWFLKLTMILWVNISGSVRSGRTGGRRMKIYNAPVRAEQAFSFRRRSL